MVVVRFSVMFDKVRKGLKKQTIRPAEMYHHLKVGDKVHCYSTKKVKGVSRPVTDELLYEGVCTDVSVFFWWQIKNDSGLAKLDGFTGSKEMREWFTKKYGEIPNSKQFRVIGWR